MNACPARANTMQLAWMTSTAMFASVSGVSQVRITILNSRFTNASSVLMMLAIVLKK